MNQELIYKKNIKKLMSLTNFEYDKLKSRPPGFHLNRVDFMMKKFNYPNKKNNFIHVAGSKGKGSTSNLISYALSDRKVGLFTSPHMHKLTERIKINNSPISYSLFNFYFSKVWKIVPIMHKEINQMPTFFEFITLLALVIFKEENVEISIIEVGLGGRLDSTNVIESDISVITGISRDHTKILGNTLIKISNEKAGIIKLNTPVILSHQIKRVSENIQSIAKSKKAKIYNSSDIKIKSKIVNTKKSFIQKVVLNDKYKFNLSLIGDHQLENLRTAIKAIEIFYKLKNEKINWALITKNISKIKMIGRCEVIKVENNYWIVDGAQNNKSSRALIRTIKKLNFDIKKIIWIYGSSDGHSSKETVKSLEKLNPKIILTKSRLPKAKSPINITKELKNLNLDIIELTNNSQEAFTKAKEIANAGDCIVAFGSLYIAAEFVELIKNIKPEYYIYE